MFRWVRDHKDQKELDELKERIKRVRTLENKTRLMENIAQEVFGYDPSDRDYTMVLLQISNRLDQMVKEGILTTEYEVV